MTVSNGQNGPVPTIGAGRRLARITARAMIAAAFAAPIAASLALPAAAQQSEAPAAAEPRPAASVATATAPSSAAPDAAAPSEAAAVPAASDAQIPAAPAVAAKKAHDLTPMGMFMAADPVVKGVMALLAAASVVVWAILLVRGLGLFLAKRRLRAEIREINSVQSLAEASARIRRGTSGRLLVEAEEELELSRGLPSEGIKERVLMALDRVEAGIGRRMAVGTGILATVGSIGPFVGLFGTVWGIMRSFIGIANSNTTNLAVVAPGIAEALLATGIGLVAAIPAVVIYNVLTRSITGYRALCGDAVALIMRHLSRDLDRHEAKSHGSARSSLRVAAE